MRIKPFATALTPGVVRAVLVLRAWHPVAAQAPERATYVSPEEIADVDRAALARLAAIKGTKADSKIKDRRVVGWIGDRRTREQHFRRCVHACSR